MPLARRVMLGLALLLLALAGCGGGGATPPTNRTRGTLIGSASVASYSRELIEAALRSQGLTQLLPVQYGVRYYRITYATIDTAGNPTTASGLVATPVGAVGARPLISYQHGTIVRRSDAPSNPQARESQMVGAGAAAVGYVVAAADYLGLGQGTGLHPFLHAASEATACVDMLRATRQFCLGRSILLSNNLFLAGYSQGGHATMALHRALEADYPGEFTVTACAPMAGPYDLSGTSFPQALSNPSSATSYYAAYLLVAYNSVYSLFSSLSEVFTSPYDTRVATLFDGTHTSSEIMAQLPANPKDMLTAGFLARMQAASPTDPFLSALRENDVYDWRPLAPVRLYHGRADKDVPYANSEVAYARMSALGADVQLINVGDTLDHETAIMPSLLGARTWFSTFANP
jgi:pimeloyl-ACP methyl ester carboxylesterase